MGQAHRKQNRNQSDPPAISYQACMGMFIISGRGRLSRVRDCPVDAFRWQVKQGIEQVVNARKRPGLTRELLEDARLDYDEHEARYYSIMRLLEENVSIVYSSWVDDRDSRTLANKVGA